jgi:Ca2+-binding EF-hand superfamily protein
MDTPSSRANEPSDHLVLLANQILTTLRDIILARYRRGRSLREIYQHFDRDGKSYFDAVDFRQATADLRIETSEKVAIIAIRQIAIDGVTQVTFGEFKVFVLDSDHHLLALNVQEQVAHLLEQQGQDYATWMMDCFWAEEESLSVSDSQSRTLMAFMKDRQQGLISKTAFVNGLKRIGLVLTPSEVSRLVDRFDVHGNEQCSAIRFLNMIQSSNAWKHAENVLILQDQAIEEAAYVRQQLASGSMTTAQWPELSEELISMCEYLGIRVLSERDMIWIASDALKAPLPVNWTAEKDAQGRTFFYNHLTNQSRWEHPLDPHFRNLRDKYRQR